MVGRGRCVYLNPVGDIDRNRVSLRGYTTCHPDKPAARSVQEVRLTEVTALGLTVCCTCAAMLESETIPVIRDMLVMLLLNMKF